jgi:hypothetical protein
MKASCKKMGRLEIIGLMVGFVYRVYMYTSIVIYSL